MTVQDATDAVLVCAVVIFVCVLIAAGSTALFGDKPSDHIGEVYESVTCPVCEDAHTHWRKP